jgi:putative restriction endonuclease
MDAELLARIGPEHRRRLAWFEEHTGEITTLAPLIQPNLRLTSTPKGIYKPEGWLYALSIRINLGQYEDGGPEPAPDGGWSLRYHQEYVDPADRDKSWTNRGLMACIDDRVPVGVFREIGPKLRQSQYEILGLAMPVRWSDGYFFLESMSVTSARASDATGVLEAEARSEFDAESAAEAPNTDYDARRRTYRQIVARQGQSTFRAALMEAYRGRCAITGCDATVVLEAAHLRPYRGPDSNTVTNGLLLRADIHTLLDLRQLALEPVTRTVALSKQLAGTQYEALSGAPLANPTRDRQRPSKETLGIIWQSFLDFENGR